MTTEAHIREAFASQAYWAEKLGSPFTGLVCKLAGERLDAATPVGKAVLGWSGDPDPMADNLPLRLAGSLHALVMNGEAPALAALYPPNPTPSPDALWGALSDTIAAHPGALIQRLAVAPQTNEAGRAAAIMTGLMTVAAQYPLPFELFELGCSAGLNLNLARFSYDLGGVAQGPVGSPVHLKPKWVGPPPPSARVEILSTRGVDISPLDVRKPEDRERLIAYVWPEQAERLARVRAAVDLALKFPPHIDVGDAAAWTEQTLLPEPTPGVIRVLYHTIAYQYFPAETQERIRAHADKVGARATKDAPFAWLRMEADPEFDRKPSIRLTLWPDGAERVLGVAHPHGKGVELFE